jgi:hypothetical protein
VITVASGSIRNLTAANLAKVTFSQKLTADIKNSRGLGPLSEPPRDDGSSKVSV